MLHGTFGMRVKHILHAIHISRKVFVNNVGMKSSEANRLTGDDNHHRIEYKQLNSGFVLFFATESTHTYGLFFVEIGGKLECSHIECYNSKTKSPLYEVSCRKCNGRSRMLPEAKQNGRCPACVRPIKHPVEHEVMQ